MTEKQEGYARNILFGCGLIVIAIILISSKTSGGLEESGPMSNAKTLDPETLDPNQDYVDFLKTALAEQEKQSFSSTPANGYVMYAYGCVAKKHHDFSLAIEYFEEAREVDLSGYARSVHAVQLPMECAYKDNHRLAIDLFETMIADCPTVPKNFFAYSKLLANTKNERYRDGDKAVMLAKRGIEIYGTPYSDNYVTLAEALASAGRFPEAVSVMHDAKRMMELEVGLTQRSSLIVADKKIALFQEKKRVVSNLY